MRPRHVLAILAIVALLYFGTGMTQTKDTDPVLSVNYSIAACPGDASVYGCGVLAVTNPGDQSISDVNLDCPGAGDYCRTDGTPLFPVHFNVILPGDRACVPFRFSLSSSSPISVNETVVYLPATASPDDGLTDAVAYSGGIPTWTYTPAVLITIRNNGTAALALANFTKPPAAGAAYAFVRSTSGQACVKDGCAVVRDMTVPAGGCGMILIGLAPGAPGIIDLPDAVLRFSGDPLGLLDRIEATAAGNAGIDMTRYPSDAGNVLTASFSNRGDARCLLETVVIREGLNFSADDRTVALWEPMVTVAPGEQWSSPEATDLPPSTEPVYNAAYNFTLLFRRESSDLTLGLVEPSVQVPAPPVPPSPIVPVIYPIWYPVITPTPTPTPTPVLGLWLPVVPAPQDAMKSLPVVNGTVGQAVGRTTATDCCLWIAIVTLAASLAASLYLRIRKK